MLRRLLALLVALAPPILLGVGAYHAVVRRLDGHLAQATPVVLSEASRFLNRPISAKSIRIGNAPLTVARLREMLRSPLNFAQVPIEIEGLTVGLRPEERDFAGYLQTPPTRLASVKFVRLYASVPALLSGRASQEGLTRVELDEPDLVLVRDAAGKFPVQNVVPTTGPPDYTKPPFRTYIEAKNGRVRFLDLAAKNGERVADNSMEAVSGFADLTGARLARFGGSARAAKNTATVGRLSGAVSASGTASRGPSGVRFDSPSAASPKYVVDLDAQGADAAYWLPYLMKQDAATLLLGRVNARVSLVGPHQEPDDPPAQPLVRAEAEIYGGAFTLKAVPNLTVTEARGKIRFADGVLGVDATATALGSPIRAVGTLEGLVVGVAPPPVPVVHATLDASNIALREVLSTFSVPVPKGIIAPPTLALSQVSVDGPVTIPSLSGRVAVPSAGYKDFPLARNLKSAFSFRAGVLRLDGVSGRVSGGGTLAGSALWRFAAPDPTGKKLIPLANEKRRLWLEARLRDAPLSSLKQVAALDKEVRPGGKVSAEVLGIVVGLTPDLTANVRVAGLTVGKIAVPQATARVSIDGTAVRVEAAHLASPALGEVALSGALDGEAFGAEAKLSGLDAGRLARILGVENVAGVVSGRATLFGTRAAPILRLRDVVALNPRYRSEGRALSADGVRCDQATVTLAKSGNRYQGILKLDEPLRVQRFPASAIVTGSLDGLLPVGERKADPKLALSVRVRRLDLDEILRQTTVGPAPDTSNVGATIEDGAVQVSGRLSDPTVEGSVRVGQILLADYPIESGRATFRLAGGEFFARKVSLLASIGELEGSLRLTKAGTLSGRFEAPELNLAALSYLTEKYASLAGKAALELNLSGTKDVPVVTASLKPGSAAEVAGTHLTELTGVARATVDLKAKRLEGAPLPLTIDAPSLSFRQAGATVAVRNARFETAGKRFSGSVAVTEGQLETVLTALRSSRLDETEVGQKLIDALNATPAPLDGRFTLAVNLSGRETDDGPSELLGDATLRADAVTIGAASVKSVEASAKISGRTIALDKLILTRDEATVELPKPGKIVLPEKQGDPVAFDLTLDSPETNLDLVRAFVPRFNLLGRVALTVQIQGTSRAPQITASLDGQNLAVSLPDEREFPLSRLAFILRTQLDDKGKGTLEVSDGRVEHLVLDPADKTKTLREDSLSFDATLPLESVALDDPSTGKKRDVIRLASADALSVKASVEKLGLDSVSAFFGGKDLRASGTLVGAVSVGGTLARPSLGGDVLLDASDVRLPRDSTGLETVNPISSAKLALTLEGSTIRVTEGVLALAPPSKKQEKESFGRVALSGSVRIDNLAELPAVLSADRPADAAARLAGEYDLTAKFEGFRPVERNFSALVFQADAPLGLGEALTGQLDGTLRVTGKKLLAPHVATQSGQSLALNRAGFLLPIREAPPAGKDRLVPLFNPTFDIDLSVPTDATMANQSRLFFFGFSVQGEVHVGGDAYAMEIVADMNPTGGRVRYPLAAPFKVKKQGRVLVTYNNRTPRITVSDVKAEGTLSVKPGSLTAASGRIRDSGSLIQALGSGNTGEAAQRYKITLGFDGPLDLFGTGGGAAGDGSGVLGARGISTASDPPLPGGTEQVLRLLGADAQIQRLASGDTQGAILSTLEQVSSNVFLASLLDPVNRFFIDNFGLSDFDINYFADGTAIVQASVAFKAPLDRFQVNVTRTVQTRNTSLSTQRVPTLLSLTYELYRFAAKDQQSARRYLPRIQLGVSNQAPQQRARYFLRGTVNF